MASFEVDQLFCDYKDIEILVKSFEDTNFVKLYKRESHTIEAAWKKCPNKNFSEKIKYSEIGFACIHNGKYKPNTKSGIRPQPKTCRIGCQFVLKFKSTADGQNLVVTTMRCPGRSTSCTHM